MLTATIRSTSAQSQTPHQENVWQATGKPPQKGGPGAAQIADDHRAPIQALATPSPGCVGKFPPAKHRTSGARDGTSHKRHQNPQTSLSRSILVPRRRPWQLTPLHKRLAVIPPRWSPSATARSTDARRTAPTVATLPEALPHIRSTLRPVVAVIAPKLTQFSPLLKRELSGRQARRLHPVPFRLPQDKGHLAPTIRREARGSTRAGTSRSRAGT